MSYFNHAFRKTFVGTNGFQELNKGRLGTPGNIFQGGQFGFVNPKTWNILDTTWNSGVGCCNLILAAGSIYQNDKIGPFHGGYQESNKSKEINPKYVSKFYRVDPCLPQSNVIHLGNTAYTDDVALLLSTAGAGDPGSGLVDEIYTDVELSCVTCTGTNDAPIFANITVVGGEVTFVEIVNGGSGYVTGDTVETLNALPGTGEFTQPLFVVTAGVGANCCKEFFCGETYTLRVDVKGSPALRLLNHNSYIIASAYGGCCTDELAPIVPNVIDSTLIFKQWAEAITRYPVISPFMQIILVDELGTPWYAPGTDATFLASLPFPADTWDHYVSPGHTPDGCAGLVLNGAYVDTKFQNCTFQISDFYELEPVRLYASEVDLNGDPCLFDTLCVITECQGRQAMGYGESVARDVILSEQYRQNFFHSDFRIREITQGYSVFDYINRNTLYTRYFLQHNVPRFNNPSSTFDNDQYLLEVITCGRIAAFETFVDLWLEDCSQCTGLEIEGCVTDCTPLYTFPVLTTNFSPNTIQTCD
jgi:hypothetical protein